MWGNSLGWTISAALVALCAGWLYIIAHASSPTAPTDFSRDERNFAGLALPTPPPGALPTGQAAPDAAALYRRAIELFLADRATYDNFAKIGKLDSASAKQLEAIDLLIQAAPARDVKVFVNRPSEIITYAREKPALDALQLLGRICVDRLGLLNQRAGNTDEAMKHYQAALALGWNLANERLTYDELALGLELIAKASTGMSSIAPADIAGGLRDFNQRRVTFMRDRIEPVVRITRAIDANIVGQRSGDIFQLAKRSQERMWRVEAILALGRVRFFAGAGGTRANVTNATALVRELATNDPDPVIRAAASAARDLTMEQHRMQ
jgi:hypothetical protein